ncbi:MAG: TonB-dependent receptor [Methylobacter tundripaludum]|uniref:Iron complex outermembrane receptor protein n=1 Tax=Methylobacter tundripaludum TaxID=173365 RepID=A0A2S6GF57_9GAMM|nr:TonB-dependent receptor [Methylobacter tundripaludum]MCK9635573.1 TonB-dependent receptor [Methylobacter tundripaludum]PPK63756.1 iron complex outermembrane receptor protein [Methylobacter tundripaludum]
MKKTTLPYALTALALTLVSHSVAAENLQEAVHAYAIPAGTLNEALTEFADQSNIKLVFNADLTRGLQSPSLHEKLSVGQGLSNLLKNSGLGYRIVDNNTAIIEPKPVPEKLNKADPATLKPVTVTGKAGDDPRSYRATHSSASTKTDTPIMETPQSIQVIKRSLIDDQQNITVSESLRNVSGVVPNNPVFTPASEYTLIRGFAAEQVVDGFTQYRNAGDRESMVNIERIEVLKGTNGILYSGGSGSPVGGLVSIVSKLPQAVASRELGFKIGTNSYYQPYVDINQPLTENILARFTGEYTNAGSYLDTVNTQRYNLNPTLTFTNNDTTTFTVQGKVSRWDQPEYQGLPATGTVAGNFSTPRNAFLGSADIPDSNSKSNGVWGALDHKFNNIWSLNLKARYAQSEFNEKVQTLYGADGFIADRPSFLPSTWFYANADLSQKQEELSFLGNATAKFNVGPTKNTLLIGADHSDLDDRGFMDVGSVLGAVNLAAPSFPVPYRQAGAGVDNMFVKNTTYGGYTQIQSTLYDRLHLLASVRVGHVGIDYHTSQGVISNGEKTKALPRVGGVFDLSDEYSLFINYSEGMRGQPFLNFVGAPQPAESTTLEGGLKFNVAHQLTGQIAGYQIERSNVAVTDNTDVLRRSKAAGQQRSRGIETDLTWQATDALSILANYAHTNAEFTDNLAGVPEGNQLAMVPENSGRLWANYRFQQPVIKGLSIGGGVYAQGQAYLSNNNLYKSDGYHSFDASIAYEYQRFKLAATVKNLTDEKYFQPYGYFGGRIIPSEGTSAYVTASVKF